MIKQRKRIINFRSLFIIALFVMAAVFCALLTCNIIWLGITLFTLLMCGAAFLCVFFRLPAHRSTYKFVTALLCFALSAIAFSSFLITAATFTNKDYYSGRYVRITGMVESDRTTDGERRVYLSDLSFNGKREKGVLSVYVTISIEDYAGTSNGIKSGSIVEFSAKVWAVKPVDGFKVNAYAVRTNIRYNCSTNSLTQEHIVAQKNPGLLVKIREFVYNKLFYAMGEKYSALAFGMLTGDKAYISDDTYHSFQVSGLCHILAVSGMHLNCLAVLIAVLLKKLRVRRVPAAIITTAVLLFYAAIAAFSPSVMRALIMSLIGIYIYLFGTHRDPLSALSAAFAMMVCVAPFYMFDAGFLFSISAVLGVILFNKAFFKALRKIKIPKAIAAPLAFITAIQVGMLPAMLYVFKSFSVYSIVANLLLYPLITSTFILIFIALTISMIIPALTLPLTVSGLPLSLIDLVATGITSLPFARPLIFTTAAVFLCYPLYFVMSRFVMLRGKKIITPICIILCISLIFAGSSTKLSKTAIVPIDTFSGCTSIVRTKNGNFLVGDLEQANVILTALKTAKINKVDGIFVTHLNESIAFGVLKIVMFYLDAKVYFPFDPINYSGGSEYLLEYTDVYEVECAGEIEYGFAAHYDIDGNFLAYSYAENDENADKLLFLSSATDLEKIENNDEFNVIRAERLRYGLGGALLQLTNEMFEITDEYSKNFYYDYRKHKIVFY